MERFDLSSFSEPPVAEKPRRRGLRIVLLLVSAFLVVSGVCSVGGGCPVRQGIGAPCTSGEDCDSGACITFRSPVFDRLPAQMRGGVCTKPCQTDADCPTRMYCALALDGEYCQRRQ